MSPEANLSTKTSGFTIGAADVDLTATFACGYARKLVANAAGNVAIKRIGDTGFTVYAMIQGQAVEGKLVSVGSTTHGSTAIAVVCES